MTKADDSRLSPGQRPEFARMSRRPAIGTAAIKPFEDWMTSEAGCRYLARARDVPHVVRINRGVYPLGRTLVQKLRDACDIPADDPLRNEARRLSYKAEGSIPELVAFKEKRRVGQYERLKAKHSVRRGVL